MKSLVKRLNDVIHGIGLTKHLSSMTPISNSELIPVFREVGGLVYACNLEVPFGGFGLTADPTGAGYYNPYSLVVTGTANKGLITVDVSETPKTLTWDLAKTVLKATFQTQGTAYQRTISFAKMTELRPLGIRGIIQINGQQSKPTVAITGITKASQAVISVAARHGFSLGDIVKVTGVVGMTEINNFYPEIIGFTGETALITDIESTDFTTYVSGGILTPYGIKLQENDVIYIEIFKYD